MGIPADSLPLALRQKLGIVPTAKAPRPNKYGAVKREVDGIVFDSTREARYYEQLKLAKAAGLVVWWLRQVPFHLPGNTKYLLDFMVFYADGHVEFIDAKGYNRDKTYRMKKRQVEGLFPIQIREV